MPTRRARHATRATSPMSAMRLVGTGPFLICAAMQAAPMLNAWRMAASKPPSPGSGTGTARSMRFRMLSTVLSATVLLMISVSIWVS